MIMAMLGRYIDALPIEALERIRASNSWRTHGYVGADGARCLLGHAENWYWGEDQDTHCGAPDLVELRTAARDHMYNWPPFIGVRFDHMIERHGMSRIVGLLKRRAERRLLERERPAATPRPRFLLQTSRS
jgi:hypothetical protein